MQFGILKKFLFAFLVLSLLPLLVLSYYAREKVVEVGRYAVESSRKALLENAMSLLEARARAIARQVELFLQGSSDDLVSLAALPPDPQIYRNFSAAHNRQIWIRAGTRQAPHEARVVIPLYREISYVDADGIERIRIVDHQNVAEGRDLSQPYRSRFGREDYFNAARTLPDGGVYASHLLGRHVRSSEQLQGAPDVESAYGGRQYEGIVRFATPLYRDMGFMGVVSLALDHRHLMEYTQHVLPIGSREVVFPSYASGNYGFLFDDEGWIITHPKFWDIRGHDQDTGLLVDPQSEAYTEQALKDGLIPFNLLYVPFIHTNYRHIALEVLAGRSGVTQTSSVGGVSRVLAFAPIRFERGEYARTGYFGGVTLGAQTDIFHRAINETSAAIRKAHHRTVRHFVLIIVAAGVLVALIAVVLAKSFTRPILLLSQKVKEIGRGQYDFSVDIHSRDELEVLARKFEEMGRQLDRHQRRLLTSLEALETSKDEIEGYSRRLERQVTILKNIHTIGSQLSVNFDREEVLAITLKNCVEGIGFERAALYLLEPGGRRLACTRVHGFTAEVESEALDRLLDIDRDDCVVTRVFGTGRAVLVVDAASDDSLTELDRRMADRGDTRSFACVPIMAGERPVGVLAADKAASRRPIATEEMASLKIIANEAAMALERARLMQEAVRERNFIASIFTNMMSGLLVVDRGGIVQTVNLRAEKFLQASSSRLVGRPVGEVLAPYPQLLGIIDGFLSGSTEGGSEVEIQRAGGRPIHLETAISTLNGKGGASGSQSILLIFRDVTRRKDMEKHLRRSDRLVSLGTLAAGIAHEIRNPLTGISLLLDDLHDRMADRDTDRRLMQRALGEIEKLEKIVTELLDFASNPSSRLVVKDLNKIIDHTLFFVHKQCRQQRVNLERDTHGRLPPVRLDPEKIKQALLNILLNALAVLPAGGTVTIRARENADPGILDGRRAVQIEVCDDGPGINPDDIDYIFDPFFTRNPNGFGLGLSITHTIIEEHNGKILVDSEPGSGACFTILLPVSGAGKA